MSKTILSLIFVIFYVDFCVPLATEIPSYINICNQTDPKLGVCIRKSINSLKPHLIKGIPELDVPSLDPLFVPEIKIDQAGGINLSAKFINITIYGAGNYRLRSVRTDVESDKMRIKIWYPELAMNALYDIRGQLLMLPIAGKGNCWGNFTDIDGVVSMQLERIKRDDKTHYKVSFVSVQFNIGGAVAQLDNLFNGDKELGDSMNQFINENWRIVAAEIRPTLEKTIGDILREVSDRLFDAFPIDKLFVS